MSGVCRACNHPQVREINRRIKANAPYEDISRWLSTLETGLPITRQALARHKKAHLADTEPRIQGRKPISADFLEAIVGAVHEDLSDGLLRPNIADGINAQKALDARAAKGKDHDLMLRISLAISGAGSLPRLVGPEQEALEGEYRDLALIAAGD